VDPPLNNQIQYSMDGPIRAYASSGPDGQTKEAGPSTDRAACPLFDNAPPGHTNSFGHVARWKNADRAFHRVLTDAASGPLGRDTFVDALCEPPEPFTLAVWFAHVIYLQCLTADGCLEVCGAWS